MNDEHATAYISAGPISEDDPMQSNSSPAITKESKVGSESQAPAYIPCVAGPVTTACNLKNVMSPSQRFS